MPIQSLPSFVSQAMRTRSTGLVIAGICLVFGTPVSAQFHDSTESESPPVRSGEVPAPTREQILQNDYLRNALSRSAEGLSAVRHADGSISVDLRGRFQSISVARIDAEGRLETGCVESHASLADFLAAHPQTEAALEESGHE